jgi:hypothetical protein
MPGTEYNPEHRGDAELTGNKQLSKERIKRFKKAFECKWLKEKSKQTRK